MYISQVQLHEGVAQGPASADDVDVSLSCVYPSLYLYVSNSGLFLSFSGAERAASIVLGSVEGRRELSACVDGIRKCHPTPNMPMYTYI